MSDRPNLPEYSVSEISTALKRTVEERFPFVRVRGEISGLKFHSSGHVYFDLKDEKAVLNAVIWKGTVRSLKVRPEAGLEVVCTGRISTYAGSSRYQIIVEDVELAGLGALMAMLEERKKKLAAEGLFDAGRKKNLPFLPEVIGVVTSPTGAVIRDIMHRLQARFPRRVLLWPVSVQGERAAGEIAAAIRSFDVFPKDGLPRPDVLIVGRGGGSIEDLMAFNEEVVIRAVADCKIPVISAVGHETDTTLIDFVSDMRAPTPTAAAELAVPVRTELAAQLLDFERRLLRRYGREMAERRQALRQLVRVLPRADQLFAQPRQRLDVVAEHLGHALSRNLDAHRRDLISTAVLPRPEQLLVQPRQRLNFVSERLGYGLQQSLNSYRRAFVATAALLRPQGLLNRLSRNGEQVKSLFIRAERSHRARLSDASGRLTGLARVLEGVSYRAVLERGFALVRGADGTLRREAASVVHGEALSLTFGDGTVSALATEGGRPATPKPKSSGKKTQGNQGDLF